MSIEKKNNKDLRFDKVDKIINIVIFANLTLAIGKLLAGWLGNSEAVTADGIESICDLGICMVTLCAARISRKKIDKEHPYGHGKIENIIAAAVGLIIIITGIVIMYSSIHSIIMHRADSIRPSWFAVAVAALTIIIKESLARYTLIFSKKFHSPLLSALAIDHRKDAITSIATVIGVGGAAFGFLILDPIAAGIAALLILKSGWNCLKDAWDDLMDHALPDDYIQELIKFIEKISGVKAVYEIKGRHSGQMLLLDIKIEVDPEMSVRHSHEICVNIKQQIFKYNENVADVMIHVDPHGDERINYNI